ncbi:hypothetical protein ACR3H8_32530, partial [Pseudomonas aeruginosa]|uniref:hypothetical protein n=1 Tax=Pseudomonas aeruginosa TaxID=287 RepID=UPI003D9C794B
PTSCSGSKRRSLNSLKNCLDRWVHFREDNIDVRRTATELEAEIRTWALLLGVEKPSIDE